jgi:type IV pilus assembly protein PilC
MQFHYKAMDKAGTMQAGDMEAADKFVLGTQLTQQGLSLIAAWPAGKGGVGEWFQKIQAIGTVTMTDKILFGKNLASMLEAGLSMARGLSVMERQTKNPKFKAVLQDLNASINRGDTLSQALARYPGIFPHLFVAMVRAGEESGKMADALNVVSSQMEKAHQLTKKIQGAMIYPGVILTAMLGIGIFMLLFIVPTLSATFGDLGVELPASTQFIIDMSNFLQNNVLLVVSGLIVVVVLFILGIKTAAGRRIVEWLLLHIPMVADLVKETNSARTARTMSALLAAGVPYLSSVQITKDVVQNSFYKGVLEKAEKNVQLGLPVAKIFEEHSNLYPVFVSEMVAVGEETGELGQMLMKVAVHYEEAVDEKTKNLSTIVEPFMMIIVGAGVGFFAISMISPMYSLVENI